MRDIVLRSVRCNIALPHRAFPDQRAFILQRHGGPKRLFSFLRYDIAGGAEDDKYERPEDEDSWYLIN